MSFIGHTFRRNAANLAYQEPRSFIISVYWVFMAAAYDGNRIQTYSVNRHVDPLGQVLQRTAGI
jgi:hypothetical protein